MMFLSPSSLICTDRKNHCLRLVNFTMSPPETSTFAGNCTTFGQQDGHRLDAALFAVPKHMDADSSGSFMFVFDLVFSNPAYTTLRRIDMLANEVTTAHFAFDQLLSDVRLFDENVLFVANMTAVKSVDLNTGAETEIAGASKGDAIGPFQHTMLSSARGLLFWVDDIKVILLVADGDNDRFVSILFSKGTSRYVCNYALEIGCFLYYYLSM